jgi:hypothetical protein
MNGMRPLGAREDQACTPRRDRFVPLGGLAVHNQDRNPDLLLPLREGSPPLEG